MQELRKPHGFRLHHRRRSGQDPGTSESGAECQVQVSCFAPQTVAHGNGCLPGFLIWVAKGARGVEKITALTSLRLDRNSRSLRTSKSGQSQGMGFNLYYARLMEERVASDDISAAAVRIRPLDSVAAPSGTTLRRREISIYIRKRTIYTATIQDGTTQI